MQNLFSCTFHIDCLVVMKISSDVAKCIFHPLNGEGQMVKEAIFWSLLVVRLDC